jgi:hypothetical protein
LDIWKNPFFKHGKWDSNLSGYLGVVLFKKCCSYGDRDLKSVAILEETKLGLTIGPLL